MLDRARRHIEARLDDPRLTPTAICIAVGTSRSNLYHLFRHWCGIARYVQERRLRRIHALLCAPGARRGLSDLAFAHGFTSAAHFSPAFRNLFGYSARDFLAPARMRTLARSLQAPASLESLLTRLHPPSLWLPR